MFRKAKMEDVERIAEIYDEIHTENEAGRMTTRSEEHTSELQSQR